MMRCLLPLLVLFVLSDARGQKQLVLLKRQDVILRLAPGDDIVFKLRNNPDRFSSYINNLFANSVKVHRDTFAIDQIERLYFQRTTFANRMGQRLIILGAGLFIIDQVNTGLVQREGFSLDSRISKITLSALATGLPLMLIRKKSQKIEYPYRLLIVEKGSAFYLER